MAILISYSTRPSKSIDVIKELRSLTGCGLKEAIRALEQGIIVEDGASVGDATYFLTRAYSLAYGAENIYPPLTVNHNYVMPKAPATLAELGLTSRR